MPTCTSCGSSDIETDHARGSAVCTKCGMVLEDNIIMAEVSFMDNDKGGSGVVGQFVNADGGKMFSLWSSSHHHGFGRDSKAVTLQNGKRIINTVASRLTINSSHIDAAYSYFKLAVEHKFIQGRKTESVVAACLYIECRKQSTPHMLLDFSDSLEINVFVLGAVYIKLCRKLRVRLPIADPSLYIVRFAHHLDFQDKTHEVGLTAMRLVSRMKRDWIQVGRRPAGICGAALLIAARLHGFSRTQSEIIDVVRVCNATLRRRLEEFSDTPSSELTPQEFQEIDLEEEADPPSFQSARRKAKAAALLKDGTVEELEKLAESNAFRELEEADSPAAAATAAAAAGEPDTPAPTPAAAATVAFAPAAAAEIASAAALAAIAAAAIAAAPPLPAVVCASPVAAANPVAHPSPSVNGAGPAAAAAAAGTEAGAAQEEELSLSDVDDDEINDAIMDEDEVREKARIWDAMNKDFLEKQAAKDKQTALDKEAGIVKKEPKKRKRRQQGRTEPAANAEEALQQMLAQKKVSKKLNYAVLEGLTMPSGLSSTSNMVTLTLGPHRPDPAAALTAVTDEGGLGEMVYDGEAGYGGNLAPGGEQGGDDGAEDEPDGDYYGGGEDDFA